MKQCENIRIKGKKKSIAYIFTYRFYFHDLLQVSNIHVKEDCEDLESKFHGFAAALCISLALNCVLIAIILMKR